MLHLRNLEKVNLDQHPLLSEVSEVKHARALIHVNSKKTYQVDTSYVRIQTRIHGAGYLIATQNLLPLSNPNALSHTLESVAIHRLISRQRRLWNQSERFTLLRASKVYLFTRNYD